jgi:hypothetical protein
LEIGTISCIWEFFQKDQSFTESCTGGAGILFGCCQTHPNSSYQQLVELDI